MNIAPLLSEAERGLEEGDLDRASRLFRRAQEQCAGLSPLPLIGMGRVALMLGRTGDAASILDTVLAQFPHSAEALTIRGIVEEVEGRTEEAMSFHNRALRIDSTLALAHLNLGRLYGTLEKWDLAAASTQLAVQHGSRGPETEIQLARALFKAGRVTEALKAMAIAVHANEDDVRCIQALAQMLLDTGSLQLAAQLLDNAIERLPNEPSLSARRATVALRMQDLEAASREARRQTQLLPRDEEAWLFSGIVDTMRKDYASAEKCLRQALRINGKSWRAHYQLGVVYELNKQAEQARHAYRAAIESDERAWEPVNNLAVMLLEDGSKEALKEARHLLDRASAFTVRGDAVLIQYNLALACFRLGDKIGTRRAAQELLRIAPREHPMVVEATRVLRAAA